MKSRRCIGMGLPRWVSGLLGRPSPCGLQACVYKLACYPLKHQRVSRVATSHLFRSSLSVHLKSSVLVEECYRTFNVLSNSRALSITSFPSRSFLSYHAQKVFNDAMGKPCIINTLKGMLTERIIVFFLRTQLYFNNVTGCLKNTQSHYLSFLPSCLSLYIKLLYDRAI